MLRKIDCVMIRVNDVEAAAAYYANVFGLRPHWSGDNSIGLTFPETDAEIVLHSDPAIPSLYVKMFSSPVLNGLAPRYTGVRWKDCQSKPNGFPQLD